MKKYILLPFILGILQAAYGQRSSGDNGLSNLAKIDLGFQGIGFTYEPRLSNRLTTDLSAGIGGGYDISEESIEYNLAKAAFYVSVTPMFYYNLEKRINKGKSVLNNSGNYIGARFTYNNALYNKSDAIRNSFLANIHWGIQRSISNHWTINTHIGVGYAQDVEYNFGTIYPAVDFKFSYIL